MARVPVPPAVAAEVLFESDRTCCVCRIADRSVQLHHIDGDHSNSVRENLAALCLEHHHETQMQGGFARRLDPLQVRQFRDDWEARVRKRRDEADRLHAESMAALTRRLADVQTPLQTTVVEAGASSAGVSVAMGAAQARLEGLPPRAVIRPVKARDYISTLPELRRRAYAETSDLLCGCTSEQQEGASRIIDVMEQILVQLAAYYPDFHFESRSSQEFVRSQITARYQWHQFRHATDHVWGGSLEQTLWLGSVLGDAEEMVTQVVAPLIFDYGTEGPDADADEYYARWKADWERVDRYPGCSG